MMLSDSIMESLKFLKMSIATINEPTGKSDTPLKFTAGLLLGLSFDALIENVPDNKIVRIKVRLFAHCL